MSAAALLAATAAITLVLVMGSIFEPLRSRGPAWWRELAGCALCAGTWIGGAAVAADPGRTLLSLEGIGLAAGTGVVALAARQVLEILGRLSTQQRGITDEDVKAVTDAAQKIGAIVRETRQAMLDAEVAAEREIARAEREERADA